MTWVAGNTMLWEEYCYIIASYIKQVNNICGTYNGWPYFHLNTHMTDQEEGGLIFGVEMKCPTVAEYLWRIMTWAAGITVQ